MTRFLIAAIILLVMGSVAAAQGAPGFDPGFLTEPVDGSVASWIIRTFGLITVLSVAPGILVMVTSFPRLIIAFAILRVGMGLQTTPANLIIVSLALFMTFYIMAPTFDRAWEEGVQPLTANEITEEQAFARIADPFRDFMTANTRDRDLALFIDIATERGQTVRSEAGEIDLRVITPAFMISEIRRGFEIGFLIVLPFLVIDLVVATITMSMGMMMLPPTAISLPFKVLFFVLVDGWNLLVGSLVRSFV